MRRSRTASAQAADSAPARTALSLAIAGGLMLLALFVLENPFFGTRSSDWPWTPFTEYGGHLLTMVVRALWVLTALWAIGFAFAPALRLRSAVLIALGAVLLLVCSQGGGGLALTTRSLQHLAPLIALGAGLLIARQRATRGLGRALAALGAVAFLWLLATGFSGDRSAFALTDLGGYWTDLKAAIEDPGGAFDRPNHLWWMLLPRTLVLLGCLFGLLAGLGLAGRTFLHVGFWILLVGLVVPHVLGQGAILDLEAGIDADRVLEQVAHVAVGQGFLLWLLGVYTVFDAARERMRAA